MKRLTKITSLFLVAFILCVLSTSVFADAISSAETEIYEIEDLSISITLPENSFAFSADASPSDELWAEANVDNASDLLIMCDDLGAYAVITANDGITNIYVTQTVSDTSEQYIDLNYMEDADLEEFIANSNYEEDTTIITAEEYTPNEQKFIFLTIQAQDSSGTDLYEITCFTIIDSAAITFSHHAYEEIGEESVEFMKELVANVDLSEVYSTEGEEITEAEAYFALALIIILVILFISLIIHIVYRTKKDKKNLKELADRLSEYRAKRSSSTHQTGESVFVNTTQFTDAAVKKYARYHCYRNKLLSPLLSIIFSIFAFIFIASSDVTWWVILVLAAVIIYCIYKFITSGSRLEKSLKKVYSKGHSRTARYVFYEEEFSISGLESGEFHPYFQISEIRQTAEYYYLYFGYENCYYVSKEGFSKGQQKEFREFIIRKTGRRF